MYEIEQKLDSYTTDLEKINTNIVYDVISCLKSDDPMNRLIIAEKLDELIQICYNIEDLARELDSGEHSPNYNLKKAAVELNIYSALLVVIANKRIMSSLGDASSLLIDTIRVVKTELNNM